MGRPKKSNKATPAQTSKASRIRQRVRDNLPVTREQREWLHAHEKAHPWYTRPGRTREHVLEPAASSNSPPTSTSTDVEHSSPASSPPPQEKRYAVDFSEPAAGDELATKNGNGSHDASSCPFGEKCPHCRDGMPKKNSVLGKCGTTGKVVYEPMDEKGARFFAGFVLNTMALGARLLRPDHALVEPEDEDYEDMSAAVKMTIDRRMPSLSVWNDLAALGFAFSAFGRRAMFDPAPMQAKKLGPSGERA